MGKSRLVYLSSPQIFISDTHVPAFVQTVTVVFMRRLQIRFNGGSPPIRGGVIDRTAETKHNHTEIWIQFSLRPLLHEYISVILKSEQHKVIHRKQQKYFNGGEWKHLPVTRCLYGSPSETVSEQL